MITAGKLSERVSILVPTTGRNEYGEQIATFENVKTVWANVIFQRGSNALVAGESFMNRSISVTMRNNKLIHDRCRLMWDNKTYSIDSFNRSGHDGSITIVATLLDEGNE